MTVEGARRLLEAGEKDVSYLRDPDGMTWIVQDLEKFPWQQLGMAVVDNIDDEQAAKLGIGFITIPPEPEPKEITTQIRLKERPEIGENEAPGQDDVSGTRKQKLGY